jgi:rubrerythrin
VINLEKTIINLAKAFVGECQARNRYTFYAKTAKKEGYEKVSEIFSVTAEQEREHAKWLFRLINELKQKLGEEKYNPIMVEAEVPTTYSTTIENLKSAIAGETHEFESMYPEFAKIAEEEGLVEIAERLRSIAIAENNHKERYMVLLKEIETNTMFKKETEVVWVCRNCGYVHTGKEAPEECPSCSHPQAYFEEKCKY